MPHQAGPGLDSAPGTEQRLLCSSSSAGSGLGHGQLPTGPRREAPASWSHRGTQMLICMFLVVSLPTGGYIPLLMWGCHLRRATLFCPLNVFEAHTNPCRQHPGALGLSFPQGKRTEGGAQLVSQPTAAVEVPCPRPSGTSGPMGSPCGS